MLYRAKGCGCERDIGMSKSRERHTCEHGNTLHYVKGLGSASPSEPRKPMKRSEPKREKAPRWLTESFRDGVDEREYVEYVEEWGEEVGICWLAQFDPAQRPCEGRLERFHFLSRQRVEEWIVQNLYRGFKSPFNAETAAELKHLAAWDSRNGGIACEAHHRRFDNHLVPVPSQQLVVPYDALPAHVIEFAADYGLEDELEARFHREAVEGAAA